MAQLNLAYPNNSEIEFEISKFPDGQQTVNIKQLTIPDNTVLIKSRLNSFQDLELIICATQALRGLGVRDISLYVPYFLGGRSDRKFVEGGVNYLKDVICPIINSQNYTSVTVLDPHSEVLEACLNNYTKQKNLLFVKWALNNIDNKDGAQDRICLVSPDAGAYKKIYDVAKCFKINSLVTATKTRDVVTGNITSTHVPISVHDADKTTVIIDDICDGGRTFIELAKAIKTSRNYSSVVHPTNYGKIYLVVTHGIFSAGLYELSKHIDGIFSTNSVKDIDVESYSDYTVKEGYLKQLNVF